MNKRATMERLIEAGLLPEEVQDANEHMRPCPFCGSENLRVYTYTEDCYVQCQDCSSCGPNGGDPRRAQAAWNAPRADAEERARIVALLRDEHRRLRELVGRDQYYICDLGYLADDIERGES